MLNRRHLRIKVLQALYAFYQTEDANYVAIEKEMKASIEKIYELYVYLLLSFSEVKSFAERRIEDNRNKMRPTHEDLNPNLKLVENQIITGLESSPVLRHTAEQLKISWMGDESQEMFRKMFLAIRESEVYFNFMNNETRSFEDDRQFMIQLFKTDIANSPLIYHFFEEESIHWMDDIDLACSMVVKTLKGFEEDNFDILPLYKDEEDEVSFFKSLFRKTIVLDEESEQLIDDYTSNWELDRIAKMDIILMKMAITELQIFNNIPTKVTLNEYIEISKFYSTPKSNGFINGILDKVIAKLEADGKITKFGRGLMQ